MEAASHVAQQVFDCLRATVKSDTIMVLPALPFPPPKRGASEVCVCECVSCHHHLWLGSAGRWQVVTLEVPVVVGGWGGAAMRASLEGHAYVGGGQ